MTKDNSLSPLFYRLDAIHEILMAHHRAGVMMPNASKGGERETVVREFFSKIHPSPTRFGSGSVVDSLGNQSGQIDIVAEFPFFPSFPTPGADERLYLAESVSFVVEVKSNVSNQWDQVKSTTRKMRTLRRRWKGHIGLEGSSLTIYDPSTSEIPIVVVGYEGPATIASLMSLLDRTDEIERPDAVFVINSRNYVNTRNSHQASGAQGMFALCTDMVSYTTKALAAEPDLEMYVSTDRSVRS